MSRLVVVGCGTVVPEPDRACSSYWLEVGGGRLLLDCGPGAVQAMARLGLPWAQITDLVITHFHADHVGALPGLFFSLRHGVFPARRERLAVWGPPGTRILFEGLAAALGDFLLDPGFPVDLRELRPGDRGELACGAVLAAHKTEHTDESQAVRVDGPDAAVGYTGDTGPMPGLADFMAGVDLLVSECSLTDEQVGDNHLSPSRVAELAHGARPGVLLLTHVYPQVRERFDVPSLVAAAGWEGDTRLASEGLSIELPGSPGRRE